MKKKTYMAPVAMTVKISTPLMVVVYSGGGGDTEIIDKGDGDSGDGGGDEYPDTEEGGIPWGD